ncbi:MAG: family 10 glycosylhydrolase [Candidatus Omnitrophica bacterium]|nr:family 10 glycosylhydrolase [Candidatus Omnitrophota bacterium]
MMSGIRLLSFFALSFIASGLGWDSLSLAQHNVISGILYNEDDSNRFMIDPPGEMTTKTLDKLVDDLAGTHVTTYIICCCAKNANYPSEAWSVYGDGFDPNLDNTQPFFGDVDPAGRDGLRRWAHNLQKMTAEGIDTNAYMIERSRKKGISPWISIRMNDAHDAPLKESPLHSRFFMDHPEFRRKTGSVGAWTDVCLDYGRPEVRAHAMALIEEVCSRYDMDGLELDWNRFPLHLKEGEEDLYRDVLTEWMGEVHEVVKSAEDKWGHPIHLVARVSARPEVAYGIGLDAVEWARKGFIDHLIVAPFWATTDFNIPVEKWIENLQGTGVGVTAGLEARVQPYPGGPSLPNTPDRRRGAALAMLSRGSQGIYLFNYFEVPSAYHDLLNELDSEEVLRQKNRTYEVTYTDIQIPGDPIPAHLPKTIGKHESAEFEIPIGPKPLPSEVTLSVVYESTSDNPIYFPVKLNGDPVGRIDYTGRMPIDFRALTEGTNRFEIANGMDYPIVIKQVDLQISPEDDSR